MFGLFYASAYTAAIMLCMIISVCLVHKPSYESDRRIDLPKNSFKQL